MQTKLDYNRGQYNVVVRKELKTPFVTELRLYLHLSTIIEL